jgi:CelD/BcsL family acetyltransferase involved in cellulose biosynthesis
MYESSIAAGRLTVAATLGFPPEIDALAERNLSGHHFLRASWYRAASPDAGRTLLVRRADGAPLAAIPTIPFGPSITGARKIAGSYWPFRSPLIAPDCDALELAQALAHPAIRRLGPVWRVGPARSDDPSISRLVEAAQMARWHVLSRPAGTSWVIDLDNARTHGLQRGSVPRKLRAGWRKLEMLGTPHWRSVRGEQWNADVLADLGRVEAESWIARTTDGSGAKFLTADQRGEWQAVLTDPVLAQMLSATILMLGERPIAFNFFCDDGPIRYGIAGSHVEDLKHCAIGKNTNYRVMDDAMAAGLRLFDTGAGDGGYKREMGAVPGYDLADLLFVRNAIAAQLLARLWGAALPPKSGPHG